MGVCFIIPQILLYLNVYAEPIGILPRALQTIDTIHRYFQHFIFSFLARCRHFFTPNHAYRCILWSGASCCFHWLCVPLSYLYFHTIYTCFIIIIIIFSSFACCFCFVFNQSWLHDKCSPSSLPASDREHPSQNICGIKQHRLQKRWNIRRHSDFLLAMLQFGTTDPQCLNHNWNNSDLNLPSFW